MINKAFEKVAAQAASQNLQAFGATDSYMDFTGSAYIEEGTYEVEAYVILPRRRYNDQDRVVDGKTIKRWDKAQWDEAKAKLNTMVTEPSYKTVDGQLQATEAGLLREEFRLHSSYHHFLIFKGIADKALRLPELGREKQRCFEEGTSGKVVRVDKMRGTAWDAIAEFRSSRDIAAITKEGGAATAFPLIGKKVEIKKTDDCYYAVPAPGFQAYALDAYQLNIVELQRTESLVTMAGGSL